MAQTAPEPNWDLPLQSISEVRADGDGDFVPDRVGNEVLVGGRVGAGTGVLRTDAIEVYIQDGTGGLRLRLPPAAAPLLTGDSVLVHGRLSFQDGMTEIVSPNVRAVDAPTRAVEPLVLPWVSRDGGGEGPDLEAHEGEVVVIEGRVAEIEELQAGYSVILLSGTDLVQLFSHKRRPGPVTFETVQPGDYVRVRGIAAQYDREAPFDRSYLIYPLVAGDVRRAGISPGEYRVIGLAALALLLLALLWAWLLRRQVRRRTEALQDSEVRYGHLFDAAADAVLVLDLDSGGEIVEANQAAQKAFGITPYGNRPDGRTVRLTDLATDDLEAARHLADADRSGASSLVMELLGPGDTSAPYEIATRRLQDGEGRTLVAMARNVSDRRDYEHGLLRAISAAEDARETAEAAAQLKSSILANMSHEIRTPLTAILGFADILREEVPEDLYEYADSVKSGGQRLLNTLNDVLDFARLDAERAVVTAESIDAALIVRDAVAPLAALAQNKGLGLHLQSSSAAIPVVHSAHALGRIVTNLVGNAIKFTESGDIRISLHAGEGFFALRVQDSGVGISDSFLPNLFEAFKQESQGHGRDFEGTGLGLAITKRLADLMGGEVRVWSERGEGSLFEVALPTEAPVTESLVPHAGDGVAASLPSGDGVAAESVPSLTD